MSEYESAAMWEIYATRHSGLAIQSSFARLRDSLASSTEHVLIGLVQYVDYKTSILPEGQMIEPYMLKRLSYSYEKELRGVVLWDAPIPPQMPSGIKVACDLNTLIETIFVSPTAPQWFYDLVMSISKKYALNCPIIRSSLAEDPIY